jgi:hypothetical protein
MSQETATRRDVANLRADMVDFQANMNMNVVAMYEYPILEYVIATTLIFIFF